MERSRVPDPKFDSRVQARVLPIVMPAPVRVALGEWRARGLCVSEDPDSFFPCRGDPGTRARQICARCAVRPDCLGYATGADEHGIWGGLGQAERRRLKRRQRRKEAKGRDETRQSEGAA
jgi:Transcription factor WhiB